MRKYGVDIVSTNLDKTGIKKKKATIQDVASLAQVVPSTVSHVINGTAPISAETQERVWEAIERLNYSPNALARALRQKRTRLIGVVLQDISSEFYARCAASILEAAREDNYVVLLCDASFNNDNVREGVHALIERRVDGLIFIGGGNDDDIIKDCLDANVPVVLGDRHHGELPSVEFDNEQSVKNLVCALYDAGYRRFAYAGEPVTVQDNLETRYRGYLEGLKLCRVNEKDSTAILDNTLHHLKVQTSYTLLEKFLHSIPREEWPQVVLTSNDMIAHGFMSAARRMGISVPEDIAVVGFDDITVSEYFNPSLTTVSQDEKLLGRSCYQLFKSVIKGKKRTAHEVLPQKIVIRESAYIPEEVIRNYTE